MGCCRGGAGLVFCGGASGAKGCYANERESGLIAEEQWVADMPGLVDLWGSHRVSNESGIVAQEPGVADKPGLVDLWGAIGLLMSQGLLQRSQGLDDLWGSQGY